MSPPRRRSSRLRGSTATPGKSLNYASNRLESLTERDETPTPGAQSNFVTLMSSPIGPRTPATAGRAHPPLAEMHPSKAHQSTTRKPDSGLRLGFTDMQASGSNQPSGISQQSPSKVGISDSSFDFTFARPGPQLGPEAQRMMDELRGEALRIKAKLAAEREKEKSMEREFAAVGSRKIAQPKGKVGRFSDVHMAEFKKMDSIAGHPSAFRAQPGRFTPTTSTNNLKRTQSKAQLDDRDEAQKKNEQSAGKQQQSDRLENTAPAKRARKNVGDDISSARPVSRGDINKFLPATPTRSQPDTLVFITTPTQASLARAASTKKPTSQIPTLAKSPSKADLNETPRRLTKSHSKSNLNETPGRLAKSPWKPNLMETPKGLTKSATTNNLSSIPRTQPTHFLHSPNKLDRVKSILRYPSSTMKKPTSIPSLSRSPSKPNLEKSLPVTLDENTASATTKHVNFTPDTIKKLTTTIPNSPSPVKSGIPRSTSKSNFGVKHPVGISTAATKEVHYPTFSSKSSPTKKADNVEYPSLAGVRPLPEPPRQLDSQSHPPPSVPGTFTFRSDHTINFGTSPKGFGSSPGQSSVRQVRRSIIPNKMPGAFPGVNKENTPPIPSVPHGMPNKKRRRVESDDENYGEVERSPKKHKPAVAEGAMLMAPKLQGQNATPKAQTSSPAKKKGVLSLSRLNMLARPKVRR